MPLFKREINSKEVQQIPVQKMSEKIGIFWKGEESLYTENVNF